MYNNCGKYVKSCNNSNVTLSGQPINKVCPVTCRTCEGRLKYDEKKFKIYKNSWLFKQLNVKTIQIFVKIMEYA